MTTTMGRTDGAAQRLAGASVPQDREHDPGATGRPPEPHPLLSRLDSPLSTYYLLIGSIATMLGIGLVMVLSASSVMSYQEKGSLFAEGFKQAQFAVLGGIAAAVAARLPVRTWRRIGFAVLCGAVVLLMLVWTPLGTEVLGNRNWLRLGGIQIQPSEFGKLGLILYGGHVLALKRRHLGEWKHAVIPLLFPAAFAVIGLIMAGGDLGTTLVIVGVLFAMLWTAGVPGKFFAILAGLGVAALLAVAVATPYRLDRIRDVYSCGDAATTSGSCWQSKNGQFALADGGIWGVGLGQSREKWGWLPERHNDFIFAIIGEELGILGSLVILALVCLIALACYRVILHSEDMFVRIATSGVLAWFVVQAMINIGAVIGLLPVIGVPLPLVSAGGSALVTTLLGLGMVVSFARNEPACRRALAERPRVLSRSLSVLSPLRKRSR